MPGNHIAECFQKSITTSDSLQTDIWHHNELSNLHFINDFVQNKSYIATNISFQEVKRIHKTNIACSYLQNKCIGSSLQDSQHDSFSSGNILLNNSTFSYHQNEVKMFDNPWSPDTLLRDDLLDIFAIPQGNNRQRLDTFYKQSKRWYSCLYYCIGSKHVVKIRRSLLKQTFPNVPISGTTIEISGSKAEGLNMKGSDIDLMVIMGCAGEYTQNSDKDDSIKIIYNSLSSYLPPGYVQVELNDNNERILIPSSEFKNEMAAEISNLKSFYYLTIHGPSFARSYCKEEYDVVPTLKSNSWPKIANEWIFRMRKFGWPSQEMINMIVLQGCCLVPVASKTNGGNEHEWRLSFSLAEKHLIFSFNHTQILVYGLLKLILKEIIGDQKEVSGILCSYFLKTTLFWVIEETQVSVWKPKYFMLCFHLCMERLTQFIATENCPNYFVRINNMFRGKFVTENAKEKLLKIFRSYFEIGFNWVLQSDTMLKLFLNIPCRLFDLFHLQKRKDLIEIAKYVLDLRRKFEHIFLCTIDINYLEFKKWLKSLLKIPILRHCLRQNVSKYLDTNNVGYDVKTRYTLQKLQVLLLHIGCRDDLLAGKLALASWLYNNRKYKDSLKIVNIAVKYLKYRLFHADLSTVTELPMLRTRSTSCLTDIDLIKNILHFSTFNIYCNHHSCSVANELTRLCLLIKASANVDRPISLLFGLTVFPDTYCHFLKSLCLLRLGHLQKSDDAQEQMKHVNYMGSETEKNLHEVTRHILNFVLVLLRNRTEDEWENHTTTYSKLFENIVSKGIIRNSPSGEMLPTTSFTDILELFESLNHQLPSMTTFGYQPDTLETVFPPCQIS